MIWELIPEFPNYAVSDQGQVRNEHTGRIMVLTQNQHGIVQVGLMQEGTQYKRSVALLVARAFLGSPPMPTFNSVINLDGDRWNNNYWNLLWRPRWFAIRYHKQFKTESIGFRQPIQDKATGEKFANSMDAATKYGLLDRDILISTLNRTHVWPTFQEFRTIKE